ncbi:sugar ABC transporter substrate-binding protein [Occultella kanbiaonis]|uniref:sugar ABC transporter substrate-binding protein n=1 Tax=Occultella kanbiaonis TaxID=2675754 RepID=UPI0012B806B5|nr:sugar ABC transporter substrate-binding protein [Occultella kanbiaonis]
MKRSIPALTAGALVLALAACGSGGDNADEPTDAGSGAEESGGFEGQTLTVWIMEGTNPDAGGYFEGVAEEFTARTGAELDVQFQPWDGAHDKFVTSIAGGTGPDVAEVGTTWTAEFAELGVLADLTGSIEGAGLDGDLVEGLAEAGTYDGALYGMPWYAGVRSIIYNRDLFEAAGITETPTNWEELTAAVEALKASDPDVIPFPIPGDSQYSAYPFIWGAGGEIATESDGTWTAALDSPEAIEGLEYYTGLALEHGSSTAAADTWNEADALTAFEQGNVGMIVAGNWTVGRIAQDAPDLMESIGAFPIPSRDGGPAGSFLGGSHLGVWADSDQQELGWEFIELMSTGQAAADWSEQTGYFPGQASALAEIAADEDPLVAPFAQQMLEAGRSVPLTPAFGQIQGAKTVEAMVQNILTGRMGVEEAAAEAVAAMNETFSAGS